MNKKSRNLLVVDDDQVFVNILKEVMSDNGFTVKTAFSINEMNTLCDNWKPDYGLIDLRIGHDSGLAVSMDLISRFPNIRLVIMTGYASIATAVEAIKMGVAHYLTKPVDVKEIMAALMDSEPNPNVAIHTQPTSVKRLEWEHIQKVLNEADGNVSEAARRLGMHRRTLQRKLNKYPSKQ